MRTLAFIALIFLFCDKRAVAQQQHPKGPDSLVIHEVLTYGTPYLGVRGTTFPTDPNRDGKVDLLLSLDGEGGSLLRGGDLNIIRTQNRLSAVGVGPNKSWEFHLSSPSFINVGGVWGLIDATYEGNILVPSDDFFIGVWDFHTGRRLGLFSAANLPAHVPPFFFWDARSPRGDLNGDGFDEVVVSMAPKQGYTDFSIYGLFDTATMDFRWVESRQFNGSYIGNSLKTRFSEAWGDIDTDGVRDIILVDKLLTQGQDFWVVRCLSGVTGSSIWEFTRPMSTAYDPFGIGSATIVEDMDGDGLNDLLLERRPWLPDPGEVLLVSALNGQEIWRRDALSGDPGFPKFGHPVTFVDQDITSIPDQNGDGVPDLAVPISGVNPLTGEGGKWIWIYSGSDGRFLKSHLWEGALSAPWELFGGTLGLNANAPAADLDGDGYPEWYYPVNLANSTDAAIALVGFRTLHHPPTAQIGETIRLGLDIPSGPNLSFRLLLSTAFVEDDSGLHFGAWNTHLLPTMLLRGTQGQAALRGTLDATGQAEIQFRIPNTSSLVGEKLFAVALVEDPAGLDGILTRSTIAMIELE